MNNIEHILFIIDYKSYNKTLNNKIHDLRRLIIFKLSHTILDDYLIDNIRCKKINLLLYYIIELFFYSLSDILNKSFLIKC